jgi:hypothetical protein
MFAKAAFGLALLTTASGALAATKTHSVAPTYNTHSVYKTSTRACARWFSWPCGLSTFESGPGARPLPAAD